MKKLVKSLIASLMLTTAINASAELKINYKSIYALTEDGFKTRGKCILTYTYSNFSDSTVGDKFTIIIGKYNDKLIIYTNEVGDEYNKQIKITQNLKYLSAYGNYFDSFLTYSNFWSIDKDTDKAYFSYVQISENSNYKFKTKFAHGTCTWF